MAERILPGAVIRSKYASAAFRTLMSSDHGTKWRRIGFELQQVRVHDKHTPSHSPLRPIIPSCGMSECQLLAASECAESSSQKLTCVQTCSTVRDAVHSHARKLPPCHLAISDGIHGSRATLMSSVTGLPFVAALYIHTASKLQPHDADAVCWGRI